MIELKSPADGFNKNGESDKGIEFNTGRGDYPRLRRPLLCRPSD
jgi:hypothetical protein